MMNRSSWGELPGNFLSGRREVVKPRHYIQSDVPSSTGRLNHIVFEDGPASAGFHEVLTLDDEETR
jgi:hypothetical protein